MQWEKIGLLGTTFQHPFASLPGVYVGIFDGRPRRVLFVGTANNFNDRRGEHWDSYCNGDYTVFKATAEDDIYQFMKLLSAQTRDQYHDLLKHLYEQKLVHVKDAGPAWDNSWEGFVRSHYSRIEVWGSHISDMVAAEQIESRLQIAVGHLWRLGYWKDLRQNWLGRQEYLFGRGWTDEDKAEFTRFQFKIDFPATIEGDMNLALGGETLRAFTQTSNIELLRDYFGKRERDPKSVSF